MKLRLTAFLSFWLASPAFGAHVERLSRGGHRAASARRTCSFELPLIEKDEQAAVLSSLVRLRKTLSHEQQATSWLG